MRQLLFILTSAVCGLILGSALSCASLPGETTRQKTASGVNLVVGSPFYATSYVSGFFLNAITYGTAWLWGEPEEGENVPIWYSADYGPNYGSVNTPWCWYYTGIEPEDREIANDIKAGTHLRQIPLRALDYEWPPTFTFCRTNVGILKNKRGDESFPLEEE